MASRTLIAALAAFAVATGLVQADLTWTGAADNDVFNEANYSENGGGAPATGTLEPSNGTGGGAEVPILQNVSITGASVTQPGGSFTQFQMGDLFTLAVSGVTWA